MSHQRYSLRSTKICVLAVALVGAAAGAQADDASKWDNDLRSAMRLIAASPRHAGGVATLRAGVEIRLDRGWKTYWRYPGDSGIPPTFDFSRSDNVKSAMVLWPAPHRFSDEAGQSIGYKDSVVFPVHVVPQQPGKPVTLRLNLDYAVCEKLCAPASGKAELALRPATSAFDAAVSQAEARVPRTGPPGDGAALSIRAVRREAATPRDRILVDVAAPDAARIELFAEGPAADWALPLPQPVPGAPAGLQRFAFELDGLPSGAVADGAAITLTAVAGDAAIEVTSRLDSPAARP